MNYIMLGRTVWMGLVAIASAYSTDALAQSPGCATRFTFCAGCDTLRQFRCKPGTSAQFATAPPAPFSVKRLWSVRVVAFTAPRTKPMAPTRRIPTLSVAIHSRWTSSTRNRERLGCYFAPIDSNWQAPALRKALEDFAVRTHRTKAADAPATEFLEDLKAHSGRVCVPDCEPRERESNGRCIAKTCGGTEVLDHDGNCVPRGGPKPARPAVANSAPRPHRTEPPATGRSGRGGCFSFNGRQFCE
jgi:hypothetical protein